MKKTTSQVGKNGSKTVRQPQSQKQARPRAGGSPAKQAGGGNVTLRLSSPDGSEVMEADVPVELYDAALKAAAEHRMSPGEFITSCVREELARHAGAEAKAGAAQKFADAQKAITDEAGRAATALDEQVRRSKESAGEEGWLRTALDQAKGPAQKARTTVERYVAGAVLRRVIEEENKAELFPEVEAETLRLPVSKSLYDQIADAAVRAEMDLDDFIRRALVQATQASAEATPPGGGAAAAGVPARPAAPGRDYLSKRMKLVEGLPKFPPWFECLTFAGVGVHQRFASKELLQLIVRPFSFESERLLQCLARADSAWAAVELGEVLRIADRLTNHGDDTDKDGQWVILGDCVSFEQRRHETAELLGFVCLVIHHHAECIGQWVLAPLEAECVESAARLAEALALAELVLLEAGVLDNSEGRGTAANPTRLQEKAWALRARYWAEGSWMERGDVEGEAMKRAVLAKQLGIVAPVAPVVPGQKARDGKAVVAA